MQRILLPEGFVRAKNATWVRTRGDQIHLVSPRVFKDQPRRLMRVFLHAQQRGLRLHPDVAQLIRNDTPCVDPTPFRLSRLVDGSKLELAAI
mgnify:CR=1 FL=1